MIFSTGLLEVLMGGFNIHSVIACRVFAYSETSKMFQVYSTKWSKLGYLARWLLVLSVSIVVLLRAFLLIRSSNHETASILNIYMCVFISCTCFVTSERYRVRRKCSERYIIFLNAALKMEIKYVSGIRHLI